MCVQSKGKIVYPFFILHFVKYSIYFTNLKKYIKENADQLQLEREEKKKSRQTKSQERIARDNEIHLCECGGTYQSYRKQRHGSSKKHVAYLDSLLVM